VKLPNHPKTSRGYTVIELMIVVTVTAILLAVAVPNFRTTLKNNRLTTSANSLASALQLARTEAITRKTEVSVCGCDTSQDPPICSAGEYEKGWAVFVTNDDQHDVCEGEVIRIWGALPKDLEIHAPGLTGILYNPSGQTDLDSGDTRFILNSEGCTLESAREVRISKTGRVSTLRVECGS